MNTVHEKPSPERQAQVVAFTQEEVTDPWGQQYIMRNLGEIAAGPVAEIAVPRTVTDVVEDESGLRMVKDTVTEVVATPDQYKKWLHEKGGVQNEAIVWRRQMIENFDNFAPEVSALQERIDAHVTGDRGDHPDALSGHSKNSKVFTFEKDNKEYVVRMSANKNTIGPVDTHVMAAQQSQGLPHFEHVVAASYEQGVTIAERIPGKPMDDLTADDLQSVTQEQVDSFMASVIGSHGRVTLDGKPSNFLYGKDGFGVVDLAVADEHAYNLPETVIEVVHALAHAGDYLKGSPATVEEFADRSKLEEVKIEMLEKFQKAAAQQLSGEDREQVIEAAKKSISLERQLQQNYSDPEWVAARIAKAHSSAKTARSTNSVDLSTPKEYMN